MDAETIIVLCEAKFSRLTAIVNIGNKANDIEFWDGCEESTDKLISDLNTLPESKNPTSSFKAIFKNGYALNLKATEEVKRLERLQCGK